MAFEVRKGRSCEVLKDSLFKRVLSLSELNTAKDKRIALKVDEIKNLTGLDSASTVRYQNAQELFTLEKAKLKAEKKKLRKIIFGESLAIIVLVVLLL